MINIVHHPTFPPQISHHQQFSDFFFHRSGHEIDKIWNHDTDVPKLPMHIAVLSIIIIYFILLPFEIVKKCVKKNHIIWDIPEKRYQ